MLHYKKKSLPCAKKAAPDIANYTNSCTQRWMGCDFFWYKINISERYERINNSKQYTYEYYLRARGSTEWDVWRKYRLYISPGH